MSGIAYISTSWEIWGQCSRIIFYAPDLFVEELGDRINRIIVRWPSVFVGFRFILLDRSLSRFQVHYTLTDPILIFFFSVSVVFLFWVRMGLGVLREGFEAFK